MSRTMSLLSVYITKLFSIFVQQCLSCEFVKPQLQIDENPTATIFAMAEKLADLLKEQYRADNEDREEL